MKAIVAVDKNWGIGLRNELLIRIPADQKRFREITTGGVVILGRKTMDTFPNGQPLKNRTNLVMSHNKAYDGNGATVLHSVEELLEEVQKYPADEVFVIGGDSIYQQLLPYCDTVLVTKIDRAYEADAHFPNLDTLSDWKMTEESEEQTYFDTTYVYQTYCRV